VPANFSLPPGGLLLIVDSYVLQGQQCMNTYWYENRGLQTLNGVSADVASDFEENVQSLIVAIQSEDVTQHTITVQVVTPERLSPSQHLPTVRTGEVASPSVPGSVAIVFKRTTDRAGREFRGRVFVAGVAQSSYEGGSLTEAFDTSPSMTDARVAIRSAISVGAGFVQPVIVGVVNDQYVSRDEVTGSTNDRLLRNQRRRQVGVGQ
jgi:hypothetical protein